MPDARVVERVWEGSGAAERIARAALLPLAVLFRAGTTVRNALYDSGLLDAQPTAIPAVSVGNLTVGGTGKTPIAAWIAAELQRKGERPAIVLRGYGGDEPLVHRVLNPGIPVEVSPERGAGIAKAAAQGATVAVLDDAFQHRGVARAVDFVLISADAFQDTRLPLPAGPWRESLDALRRASAVIITRKVASDADVARARAAVAATSATLPCAVARLEPAGLRNLRDAEARSLRELAERRVLAIAAVGDPSAFVTQLERLGARCTPRVFADHHAFSDADVHALVAEALDHDLVVCTLKDAVKLEPRWPRAAAPAWYVSQRVFFEDGEDAIRRLLDGIRVDAPSADFTGTSSASR